MANYFLARRRAKKEKECKYRSLTKKEIDVIDPHEVKGNGGGKRDLAICGAGCDDQGAVVDHVKKKHYDKDGNIVRPKDIHYEPTGININDPDIQRRLKEPGRLTTSKVVISLYVTDFEESPAKVLNELGIKHCEKIWKKGEPKRPESPVKYAENGFRIGVESRRTTFEGRVLSVLKKISPSALKKACGKCSVELSIGAYIVGDDVPDLHLPTEAIDLLHELGAEVDFDLYNLPAEDEEGEE